MNAAAIHSNAGVRSQCWDLALDALALRVHITRRAGGREERGRGGGEGSGRGCEQESTGRKFFLARKKKGGREREVCDMRQGNRMKASKVEGNSFKMRGA